MGVSNLWKVLNKTSRTVDLEDLRNKTLAVDLSIWICESNCIKYSQSNVKPHLRSLFFRCKSLLEIGCTLIFVREGDVFDLKIDTMKKRNENRFGSSQSQSQNQGQQKTNRSRYDYTADEVKIITTTKTFKKRFQQLY
jgi:flap endonuclease GEN